MTDLNKVFLRLEKIESKNLEQNPDNLKHFLMKDLNHDCEEAMKLIDGTIVANIIKSLIFNDKVVYRVIKADSNADDTIIVSKTQEDNSHVGKNDETGFIKDSETPQADQQISNILTITENFCSSLEAIKRKIMKMEDHQITFTQSY